jgi:hypothetical protein
MAEKIMEVSGTMSSVMFNKLSMPLDASSCNMKTLNEITISNTV